MDDDWESEDFVPPPPIVVREQQKSQWDDEDVEVDEVKESREDEDKPKAESSVKAKPTNEKKKTTKSKVEKSMQSEEKTTNVIDERVADPLADKLRQQRLVEESDYQVTTELFGKSSSGHTLDGFIPKSEEDFLQYSDLISQRLRPFEKSFHYLTLLKAVMRSAVSSLTAADAKEVASSLTVISNEKLKLEKEAAAGKKKAGSKKKQLLVDKPDDDGLGGHYDDLDEYDFM